MPTVTNAARTFAFSALALAALAVASFPPRLGPSQHKPTGVHDMTGAELRAELPARRTMIFPPLLWDYVTVDKGCAHIQSAAQFSVTEIGEGLLGKIYPEAVRVPFAPSRVAVPGDPEQILLAAPDLVVCFAWFTSGLDQLDVPILRIRAFNGKTGGDQMATSWRVLGAVTGQNNRVERLAAFYDESTAKVTNHSLSFKTRPSCLYVYRRASGTFYVAHKSAWENSLIQKAGGRNAAENLSGPAIGYEQLLLLNPDILFIAGYDADDAVAAFCADRALQGLPAIRNHHVYRQPHGGSRMAGLVEEPLLVDWMAELLHPEMPRRFRAMLRDTYVEVYGVNLDDETIDRTLCYEENAGAVGFERFRRTAM